MILLIDIPKTDFGNTNDSNTSRRFSVHPNAVSRVTVINIDLTKRLKVIVEHCPMDKE